MKWSPFFALAAAIILTGLLLRLGRWHIPLWAHHYGGGVLWGAMVFLLVAGMRPRHWSVAACGAASVAIIAAVECSRLVHEPSLDAFRLTTAGQLLLGHIFSQWNMLADVFGATLAAASTLRLFRRPC